MEGITLKVIPYKETGNIVTLFSKEKGIITCYLKTTKKEPLTWLEPFVHLRGKLKDEDKEMALLKEAEGVTWYFGIRESREAPKILLSISQFLIRHLEERSPSPLIYQLFKGILKGFDQKLDPKSLEALFYLKFALFEGLLAPTGYPEMDEWIDKGKNLRRLEELPLLQYPELLTHLKNCLDGL